MPIGTLADNALTGCLAEECEPQCTPQCEGLIESYYPDFVLHSEGCAEALFSPTADFNLCAEVKACAQSPSCLDALACAARCSPYAILCNNGCGEPLKDAGDAGVEQFGSLRVRTVRRPSACGNGEAWECSPERTIGGNGPVAVRVSYEGGVSTQPAATAEVCTDWRGTCQDPVPDVFHVDGGEFVITVNSGYDGWIRFTGEGILPSLFRKMPPPQVDATVFAVVHSSITDGGVASFRDAGQAVDIVNLGGLYIDAHDCLFSVPSADSDAGSPARVRVTAESGESIPVTTLPIGLWVAVNVPPGQVTVELLSADLQAAVARDTGPVVAGTVTHFNLIPLGQPQPLDSTPDGG